MTVIVLFAIGFVTWSLCFARSMAWHENRAVPLVMIVMIDELIGILTGMYLARSGTWVEAFSCAAGGAVAALIMFKRKKG